MLAAVHWHANCIRKHLRSIHLSNVQLIFTLFMTAHLSVLDGEIKSMFLSLVHLQKLIAAGNAVSIYVTTTTTVTISIVMQVPDQVQCL